MNEKIYKVYTTQASCWNCNFKGDVTLPKGVSLNSTEQISSCPNCGCRATLRKLSEEQTYCSSFKTPSGETVYQPVPPLSKIDGYQGLGQKIPPSDSLNTPSILTL